MDNPISFLQIEAQRRRQLPPSYTVLETRGTPHAPQFRMRVTVSNQSFDGDWADNKQAAKSKAARAALENLAKLTSNPTIQTSTATTRTRTASNPNMIVNLSTSSSSSSFSFSAAAAASLPSQSQPNTAAVSRLYELAQAANKAATDCYKITGTGAFQCYFMWGKDMLPMSDPHPKKKDAKTQAALLALAAVSNSSAAVNSFNNSASGGVGGLQDAYSSFGPQSASTSSTTQESNNGMQIDSDAIFTSDSSASASAAVEKSSSMHSTNVSGSSSSFFSNSDNQITPASTAVISTVDQDPIRNLHFLVTTQFPASTPPVFTEVAAHGGFQFSVALDNRVIAVSEVFIIKKAAKQEAAAIALEKLTRELKEEEESDASSASLQRKRKRRVTIGSTSNLSSNDAVSVSSSLGMLDEIDGDSLWDSWELELNRLVAEEGSVGALGIARDMKKCTNNIILSVCLALQGNEALNVDRVVVGGAFGRGTIILFDYSVEITLIRNRVIVDNPATVVASEQVPSAPAVNDGTTAPTTSIHDSPFHALVAFALKSSSISSSIYSVTPIDGKDGGGVQVWYNGIQSIRFRITDGINFVNQKGVDGLALAVPPRLKQLTQQTVAVLKIRELYGGGGNAVGGFRIPDVAAWAPSFAETNLLFFKNHGGGRAAQLSRILKFWLIALNFDSSVFRDVSNALELVAVHAFDYMDRAVNYDSSKYSLLVAIEYAFKCLENWKNMRIFWTEYYTRSEIQASRFHSSSPPLLLDPANPFFNLFETVSEEVWQVVGEHAKTSRGKVFGDSTIVSGIDFLTLAMNPTCKEIMDVDFFDITYGIIQTKDQFNFTIPDFQESVLEDAPIVGGSSDMTVDVEDGGGLSNGGKQADNGLQESARSAAIGAIAAESMGPSRIVLQKLVRLLQGQLIYQTHRLSGTTVSGSSLLHGDVSRLVDASVVGVQRQVRVDGLARGGGGAVEKPTGTCVGTVLWPVCGRFVVNVRIEKEARMFRNTFQSGFLSILYSIGSKPLQIWDKKVRNGHIKRITDNDIQSSVLEIIGTNVSTNYITCPSQQNRTLGIKLPFLVMIIKNLKKYFTFEVQVLDDKNVRRRFRASNYQSTTRVKPFICTMPMRLDDGWNQIQFNLSDFTRRAYGTNYIETLRVQIHANCRIRRIYFSDRLYSEEELPPEFKLFLPIQKQA
ncbi:UNVERIFIED_CONTAM: hypothetical protein HDU68_011854 [Siphonaria sp. JEL0065]|nr:hypothetical protein HDU68_011854 [Siphonaria sp. JEL0065]